MRLSRVLVGMALLVLVSCEGGIVSSDDVGVLSVVLAPAATGPLATTAPADAFVVILTGPTSRQVNASPGEQVTIAGLLPGTYTVRVEAYSGSLLLWFAEDTVSVTAGQNSAANLSAVTVVESLPVVTITEPATDVGVRSNESVALVATATDAEDGDLTASIVWASNIDGPLGTGGSIAVPSLTVFDTHTITATVEDAAGQSASDQVEVTVFDDPPDVTITAPGQDTTVADGDPVTLTATADDPEDGDLTSQIEWDSDLDGALGTGGTVMPTLSQGVHTINATVHDNVGQARGASIAVTVVAPVVLLPDELCSEYPAYAIASFEDAALEDGVRSELGLGPSDNLTCGLVSGLTSLIVQNSGVAGLAGVQNLTGLTELNLGGNQNITDLGPVSDLTSLTSLTLAINMISDVGPLSQLTNLTHLNLNNNLVGDVTALSGLVSLSSLHLSGNSITDISSLTGLTALSWLVLSDNAGLSDIQPLIDNTGIGSGDTVDLEGTIADCADVSALVAKNVTVASDCPGYTISGNVYYSSTPLDGVTVDLVVTSPTDVPVASTQSSGGGYYEFLGVLPGEYWVKFNGPDPSFIGWVANQRTVVASPVTWDMWLPKVIQLVSPPRGSTVGTATPTLEWSPIAEAVTYTVQINETLTWNLLESTDTGSANPTYVVQTPLTQGVEYTWQVNGYDSLGKWVGTTDAAFTMTFP